MNLNDEQQVWLSTYNAVINGLVAYYGFSFIAHEWRERACETANDAVKDFHSRFLHTRPE